MFLFNQLIVSSSFPQGWQASRGSRSRGARAFAIHAFVNALWSPLRGMLLAAPEGTPGDRDLLAEASAVLVS